MEEGLFAMLGPIEQEFCEGYTDGRDLDTPRPGRNRSPAYKHSWIVGRAERRNKPIPAETSRRKAAIAEAKMRGQEPPPPRHAGAMKEMESE